MQKTCKQCGQNFQIPEEDLKFYDMISPVIEGKQYSMPEPDLCFFCRHQKRLAFRNEINLYHRKCDFSGKQVISMYSPEKPYRIYDQHIWWGDDWDPLTYGKDFDFNKTFFEQYLELQKEVPRMSLNNLQPENSDYCNLSLRDKDSYLCFTADENDKCAYLRFSDKNYSCYDCDYTYGSTECYECLDVEKGNRCFFCHKCYNSSGLIFCYNMIGCHDCIGCTNLRNKRFCYFNEQLTKEEFEEMKKELKLNSYFSLQNFSKKFNEFLQKQPRKYLDTLNCENSLGDNLRDCKNAQYCYNSIGLEDCKYMINCYGAKNCYDWDFVALSGSVNCHEMSSSAQDMVNCHFCSGCWQQNSDLYYCELCLHSGNLFGCIALRHKQYCILNKQYTKEEYPKMLARIIEHMQKTGEWGQYFPMEVSCYAYNETLAGEYFPLSKENVEKRGWKFKDDVEENIYRGNVYEIPDDVKDVSPEITKQILVCEETKNPFKVIQPEVDFCKKMGIALPRISFKQRHKNRMSKRNGWRIYDRNCSKCGVAIKTTYEPNRVEPVYCEKCYKETVY